MYIEYKGDGYADGFRTDSGPRSTFSRTGATLHYGGQVVPGVLGEPGSRLTTPTSTTGEKYWISGPRKDGTDRLYKSDWPVEIDEDVREEYWTEIRKRPGLKDHTTTSLSTTKRPNATSLTRQ